jgi:hypothetical protein
MSVSAVAREAARAGTLADNAPAATAQGIAHGEAVAAGYRLTNGSLQVTVDPGDFARGGRVQASARYYVSLADLPLLGSVGTTVASDHVERVDLYRSRWPTGD